MRCCGKNNTSGFPITHLGSKCRIIAPKVLNLGGQFGILLIVEEEVDAFGSLPRPVISFQRRRVRQPRALDVRLPKLALVPKHPLAGKLRHGDRLERWPTEVNDVSGVDDV